MVEFISPTIYANNDPKTANTISQPESINNTASPVPDNYQGEWYAENSAILCDSNPLKIDSEKLMHGNIQSTLRKDDDGFISEYGDKLKINDDSTLTVILKDNPENRLIFKKCGI